MSLKEKIQASLTERRRMGLRIAGTAAVLLMTLWMSVSVISYIFTWKQDQSLVSGGDVAVNAASTSGFSLGKFLVSDSFGLAALCIVLFMIL